MKVAFYRDIHFKLNVFCMLMQHCSNYANDKFTGSESSVNHTHARTGKPINVEFFGSKKTKGHKQDSQNQLMSPISEGARKPKDINKTAKTS